MKKNQPNDSMKEREKESLPERLEERKPATGCQKISLLMQVEDSGVDSFNFFIRNFSELSIFVSQLIDKPIYKEEITNTQIILSSDLSFKSTEFETCLIK